MIYRPHLSCLAGLIVLATTTGALATEFTIDVAPTVIGPSEVDVEIRSNIPGTIEVMLGLGLADQDPDDVFIGTSKRITIKNGRATATISKPGLPSGKYEVEVSFYPRWGPQDSIAKAAGANSEIHALQDGSDRGYRRAARCRAATGERSAVDHGERLRWNSLGSVLLDRPFRRTSTAHHHAP